jgi:hypothetical protein
MLDDAAMFPPGNVPLPDAVPAHARHRDSWYADMVGPFVCPATRLDELAPMVGDRAAPPLSIILRDPREPVAAHWAVEAVECPPPLRDDLGKICEIWRNSPRSSTVAVYAECSWDDLPAAVGKLPPGVRLKLRTGGTSAAAFPTETQLAEALLGAAGAGVPFKCTAGLHHAVRHRDADTGFEHHGFLNVLLATHTALAGGEASAVCAALAERDPEAAAARVGDLSPAEVEAVRGRFTSFGTCSITDPVEDLWGLGLLEEPA